MCLKCVHLSYQRFGAERVADPPACHRIGLACAVDQDDLVPEVGSNVQYIDVFCGRVDEPLINFVENDPEILFSCYVSDHFQSLFVVYRP